MVAPNSTAISSTRIPQSPFLDNLTQRPAREWLYWLQNPNFVTATINEGYTAGAIISNSYVQATTYVQAGTYIQAGSYIRSGTYMQSGSYITAATHIIANTYIQAGSYITAATTVNAGTSVNAGTTVNATTDVTAGNDVAADNNVTAGNDVIAINNVTADNDVIADNDVTAGADVNLSGRIATPTYIDFNNNVANPSYTEGRVFYDSTQKALSYYNDVDGVTVNMGQEQLVRVFNNSGTTILNGQICYLSGGANDFPEVMLAKADAAATSASTLGMATFDIPDGEYGYVCTSGLVHDLDTSAYGVGDTLYLSAATAGGITDTMPLQPNYDIIVGYVTKSDATLGTVYVQIDRLPWFPNGEIRLTAASTALPTTPTVFTAPSVITQQGISYDNATGVLTINTSGSYTLSHTFNCDPSAANKKVYFYVEESTDGGSTWVIARYSARQLELINGTETQLIIVGSRFYATGTKIRYYLWGDATVTLKTTDLPGTTPGTVTLPAYRLTLAG